MRDVSTCVPTRALWLVRPPLPPLASSRTSSSVCLFFGCFVSGTCDAPPPSPSPSLRVRTFVGSRSAYVDTSFSDLGEDAAGYGMPSVSQYVIAQTAVAEGEPAIPVKVVYSLPTNAPISLHPLSEGHARVTSGPARKMGRGAHGRAEGMYVRALWKLLYSCGRLFPSPSPSP